MALQPEAGHEHQYGDELQHHAGPHQLVGPGPAEVPALEQGEDHQAEDDEDNRQQDVQKNIDECDHGADVGRNTKTGNGVGDAANLKMFLLLRLRQASSRKTGKIARLPVQAPGKTP